MQEEVTQRTVALCVEATKLSAGMLQQAMKKVLDEMQKGVTGHKTKLHHGKQKPGSHQGGDQPGHRPTGYFDLSHAHGGVGA